jgi:hypothetical protein
MIIDSNGFMKVETTDLTTGYRTAINNNADKASGMGLDPDVEQAILDTDTNVDTINSKIGINTDSVNTTVFGKLNDRAIRDSAGEKYFPVFGEDYIIFTVSVTAAQSGTASSIAIDDSYIYYSDSTAKKTHKI